MTKRLNAKYKINRRLGVNLWGRAKSPINEREYGPGVHGQRRRKPTDYGQQLMAKQKLKGYYGNISERQFYRYYEEAIRRRGDTSENLVGLLERRLDAVVYRMKLVQTVFAARQFVNHGHVRVNGHKVDIASYNVVAGDTIEIRAHNKSRQLATRALEENRARVVPGWLARNDEALSAAVTRLPTRDEMDPSINEQLIVEFYSRF
jgi:small subunit ribosomal protein S4